MKQTKLWSLVFGAGGCVACLTMTSPVSSATETILHGSVCQNYDASQGDYNSLTGVTNNSGSSFGYACPLVRQNPTNTTGFSSGTINVYDNSTTTTITCAFRAINQFATAQFSQTQTTGAVAVTGNVAISFTGPTSSYSRGSYAVGCTLPSFGDYIFNIDYTEN